MDGGGRTGLKLLLWGVALVFFLTLGASLVLLRRAGSSRDDVALDPGPWRDRIEPLEEAIYGATPDAELAGDRAADLALALQEGTWSPSRRHAATEVFAFSGRCGTFADAGYAAIDPADLRSDWEEVRGAAFVPALWFRRTPAAGERPLPLPLDREKMEALRRVLSDAEDLADAARAEAMAFGEIAVDIPEVGAERADLERRWNVWAETWERRVREAGARVPAVGANEPADLAVVAQAIGSALRELLLLTRSGSDFGVPFRSEREDRIAGARGALGRAREVLRRLDP